MSGFVQNRTVAAWLLGGLLLGQLSGASLGAALGAISAVSVPETPSRTAAGNSVLPLFSADGRGLAFLSRANNLVTNDDSGTALDLFWRDLASGTTELVSVSTRGWGGANASILAVALSADGRFIAFETEADNLVPGDTNGAADIFIRDRVAGATALVSRDVTGMSSGNGRSFDPRISADGRNVAFTSEASNLVSNDGNGTNDVFICNLGTGTITVASLTSDGSRSPDGASHSPSLSADGRRLAFVSHATNLVEGVTNQWGEIYVRDLEAGTNLWASASHLSSVQDPQTGRYSATQPELSADGRYVAFKVSGRSVVRFDTSRPTNMVVQTFPGSPDVFLFQDNPRFARFGEGLQSAALAFTPAGRYLAVATGTNGASFSTVRHLDFEALVDSVIYSPPAGSNGPGSYSTNRIPVSQIIASNPLPLFPNPPAMASDGTRVLYLGPITNLPAGAPPPVGVWLRDVTVDAPWLISTNQSGEAGPGLNDTAPALTSDGTRLAWESPASDLVEDDRNGATDIFVRDTMRGTLQLISERRPELPAATGLALSTLASQAVSAPGGRVAFLTFDSNLGPLDQNVWPDAYIRDLRGASNLLVSSVAGPPTVPTPGTNLLLSIALSADGRFATWVAQRSADYEGPGSTEFFWSDLTGKPVATNLTLAGGVLPPALGPDGRLVAFHSTNLLDLAVRDDNRDRDVFLRYMPSNHTVDLGVPVLSRAIMAVSTDPSNATTGNGRSVNPVLSPDGGWVAFQSVAPNLIGATGSLGSAYQLMARRIHSTGRGLPNFPLLTPARFISYQTVASAEPGGRSTETPIPGGAWNPHFSADSHYLFFESNSNQIYRHDLRSDFVITTTPTNVGFLTNYARLTNDLICTGCGAPSVSGDGRYVVYELREPFASRTNIYLRDLASGQTVLVSAGMGGNNANGVSFSPLITVDARFVVFSSRASNLVANDTNRAVDVFLWDRLAGATRALSMNFSGTATGNRASSGAVISADGRTVAFQSFASDLVPGDYNGTSIAPSADLEICPDGAESEALDEDEF